MKRTSVMFPAELKARAVRAAQARGISFGALLRRSLEAALDAAEDLYVDPVFADGAVFDGPGPTDLAGNHDGYLYSHHE